MLQTISVFNPIEEILAEKGFQKEFGEWESPDGKKVPYTRFIKPITPECDDWNRYQISVTVWVTNISVEITRFCGECGAETDSEDRWAMIQPYRIFKVPYGEFLEKSEKFLSRTFQILQEKFQP